ncbi:predicted protein [Aspergillus terreus NIH2624]|uniref:Transmembrane protein n=1 Tax=Aspergillus terreus (strain NIH 2624 / FGSC A1156) TaxID=341663 RepID=Q0CQP9_ASPTN|nr:uncharacterized protein ATEG_03985 [Aspergillus terreus NIH2624]EAU35787.1 predicted protein [Aspergillus terreus NIH2624]
MASDGEITPEHPPGLLEPTSLEVQCLPNAVVQILDAQSSSIRVHKIFKTPLVHVHGQDSQSSDPDSPLFAFLNLASDASVESEQVPSTSTTEVESEPGTLAPSDERHLTILESDLMAPPSLGPIEPLVPSVPATDIPSTPRVDTDLESRNLGKRNARTACLTDSEDEKGTSGRSRPGARDAPTSLPKTRRTAASASPKKSTKYAPLKTQHTRGSSVPGISDLEERLTSGFRSIITDVCGESVDSLFGAASRAIKGESTSEMENLRDRQRQPTKTNSFIPVLKRLNTDLGRQTMQSPAPTVLEDMSDSGPMEEIRSQDNPRLLRRTGQSSPTRVFVEPIVQSARGLLYLECPEDVLQAAYKIVILANISMFDEDQRIGRPLHPPGWYTLIVPGLPKLKDDQNGYFLFLISPGQVIEFSTASLNRYNMVENCFFAEFANPESFEVTMCVHAQECYGPLKDFTVDQDIRATLMPTRRSDEQISRLRVRYHAVCSLRFSNIYVAAERCRFFLKVEGGPESFSQCTLEAIDEGLQVIELSADMSRTTESVSRIQIICSSREFDEFCLMWEVAIPKEQQAYWLPSIYPDLSSVCLERSKLRHAFTRLDSDSVVEPSSEQEVDVESSGSRETYNEGYAEDPISADKGLSQRFAEVMRMMEELEFQETERRPLRVDRVVFLLIVGFSLILSSLFSPVVITGPGVQLNDMGVGNYTGEGLVAHGHESGSDGNVTLSPVCVCPHYGSLHMLRENERTENDADPIQDSMEDAQPMLDEPDEGTKNGDTERTGDMHAAPLSLRDRIDYFLGWKGPNVR